MKKVSVYFTDPQMSALAAQAARADITFAEALRRALDLWLTHTQGGTMTPETPTTVYVTTVYVKLGDEDYARCWRQADLVEDAYGGTVEIWRGERKVAKFSLREVSSWWIEDATTS